MSRSLREFIAEGEESTVGEFLRAITFVGDGTGCYSNFEVRDDAIEWGELARRNHWQQLGREDPEECASFGCGYSFEFDCKKNYGWQEWGEPAVTHG